MDYRDRNDSPYDRNQRLSGREEQRQQQQWQDDGGDSREWERARDWDRAGPRDFARGDGAPGAPQGQARQLGGQHNDLRSQGRGFRDEDYGHSRFLHEQSGQRVPNQALGGAYSGPTGPYSGYRDGRDREQSRFQEQDWRGNRAPEGYFGSRASSSDAQNYAGPQNYGGTQGQPRSYEIGGSRGEYRGSHEDSFGQELRDAGRSIARTVKRVFRGPKGYKRSDERIREDVSDRFATQDHVDPSDLEVQVTNGEVTLTGTVQSRHEKFLAEELADNVAGVNDVHNQLRVRRDNQPTSSTATTLTGNQPERTRNGHA